MPTILSKRLQWIANHVPPASRLADVGTDHALLPIYLVEKKRVTHAIATDVAEGPYQAAQRNVNLNRMHNMISVRLGNGLATVDVGEADVISIAGMGGATAAEILRASTVVAMTAKRLIIQPMNASRAVRQTFIDLGFALVDEAVVEEDGRFYELLVAETGADALEPYSAYQVDLARFALAKEYGPLLLAKSDTVTQKYFREVQAHLARVIAELSHTDSEAGRERRHVLQERLHLLQQLVTAREER